MDDMSATTSSPAPTFGEELDEDSFWLKVMSECLDNPVVKLPVGKRLLLLGDNEAEKTLLVSKLQGCPPDVQKKCQNFTKGNGLEYKYLNVKDEYCENHTKLGVWILDGDQFYKPLLKYALDKDSMADTTVLLFASMTKPWDIYDTITSWTDIIKTHIEGLGLTDEEMETRRNKVLERYREYIEPGLSIYGSLAADTTRELQFNLGVEIVVVITRTEFMKDLRNEFGYEEEHFDFLQYTLREFCLSHGAALFYVSVKEDRNCDFLLKYLLHKIYSFPFRIPGVLVEPDAILIPAGWDTKNKIRFLSDGMLTISTSTPFKEVVFKPARLYDAKRVAAEVVAQRDQEFLADMMSEMDRQASEEKVSEAPKDSSSMTATVVQRNVARRMTRAQSGRSPQKKVEPKIVTGDGDNTLSNFFHSLLNRRTSAPVDRPVGLSGGRTFVPKNASQCSSNQAGNASIPESEQVKIELAHAYGMTHTTLSSKLQECFPEHVEAEADGENPQSKLKSTAHLSLDQENEAQQLPEYFLSNSGGDPCGTDCSFIPLKDSSSTSFDLDDQFSPPLDRVRSSFNPPLKLLLEKSPRLEKGNVPKEKVVNGSSLNNGTTEGSIPDIDNFSSFSGDPDTVMPSMPCKVDNLDQNTLHEE